MSATTILQRLAQVKETGHDTWQACCPLHDDKSQPLMVKAFEDGFVLVRCANGCDDDAVLRAIGLDFTATLSPFLYELYLLEVRKARPDAEAAPGGRDE